LPAALSLCTSLLDLAGELTVSTSCSLLHVPPGQGDGTPVAQQKVDEVVTLGRWLSGDRVLLGRPSPPG
jgi:5-methyltetrahydropteroyltriglutamate--homocysteine methyltransferase